MSSALRLRDAGYPVVVLEAADVAGGRAHAVESAGGVLDAGGTFIAAQHRRVRSLAARLQVELTSSRLERSPARWLAPSGDRVGFLPPGMGPVLRAGQRLAGIAREVPSERPWEARTAERLDAESVASFLDANGVVGGSDAAWLRAQLEALGTVPLGRLSLLQLVWWVARPGGVLPALRDTRALVGAQGTSQLTTRLAREVASALRLSSPVSAVTTEGPGRVTVTAEGEQIEAVSVIVAVPQPVLDRIRFEPRLRPEHQEAVESLQFGAASKVVATTSAPAARWRTVFGGRHLKTAWRIGSVLAGVAPHLTSAVPSEQDLVDELAEAFDLSPAQLIDPKVIDWETQPHVEGTYIAYAPGQLTRHAPALAHGVAPIWFAGAERSSWPDSMEGAVESGARAAHLVIEHLERTDT